MARLQWYLDPLSPLIKKRKRKKLVKVGPLLTKLSGSAHVIKVLLYVNNKGTDQSAHSCSLVSIFVVCFLEGIMMPLVTRKIAIF